MEPVVDFDLMVADLARVDLLVELLGSPKRPFFLRCVDLVVGDAVRTEFHTASRVGLEEALERAGDRARDDVALAKWVEDSRTLIARPRRSTIPRGATVNWLARRSPSPDETTLA